MAKQHGRHTVVKVGANDLSQYTSTSEIKRAADTHDSTAYGATGHEYHAGLTDGTFTMGGTYDNTASTGPRAVLNPLIGADAVTVVRQPEGAGTGKPQDSFQAVLQTYTETNPVADMVAWQAEFQISGAVDSTPQV